jgi:hypothetical protein
MNTVFRLPFWFILTLAAASPALAHSPTLPDACRVRGAQRVAIGSVQFSPAQLQSYEDDHRVGTTATSRRNCHGGGKTITLAELIRMIQNARPPKAGTQGDTARTARIPGRAVAPEQPAASSVAPLDTCGVVDKWTYAAADADAYCNAPSRGNGNAYFVVTVPGAFNAIDHHSQYADYSQGLTITCYVCEAPTSGYVPERTMTPQKEDVPTTKPARER